MSGLSDARRRLRERAEHVLREAAMEDLRREHPQATVAAYRDRRDHAWRLLFVPAYRRVPWAAKTRAMRALGMTAEASGWTPPERCPREPWRPPARDDGRAPL